MRIVDANIVLRYLLADNEDLSGKAAQIIDNNRINLPIEVLCEVVYVLEKVYKAERKDICGELTAFLSDTDTILPYREAVLSGLQHYAAEKLDFVDCLLAGYAEAENAEIHTFDKNLKKLIGRNEKRG
ncbi:MAG: PIN domain-containing protein [Oscillospiraceae bacterium]|jgi:predicted nucleic-acid-binding protein|nr:PIN domain-containing protein [Oscillospiraceae bacterium]